MPTRPGTGAKHVRHRPCVNCADASIEEYFLTRDLKPKTARPYRRLIAQRILPTFGNTKVQDMTRAAVDTWHYGMRKTPVEANRALSLLHKVLAQAEVWGWREGTNPASKVQKYGERPRERYLTTDELHRLAKAITDMEVADERPLSPFLALAFRLLLLTGMRKDEVLTLRSETST